MGKVENLIIIALIGIVLIVTTIGAVSDYLDNIHFEQFLKDHNCIITGYGNPKDVTYPVIIGINPTFIIPLTSQVIRTEYTCDNNLTYWR